MKPIYSGFDGLEFAIKVTISQELDEQLADAKAYAQENQSDLSTLFFGLGVTIRETGARGGYAYSMRENTTGDWFFKRPNRNDPWGIRFSASSSALVLLGLEGIRLRAAEVLLSLGIDAPIEAYALSRVDFAVDFLAPDFAVCPDNFVLHSRTSRKSIDKIEDIEVNGRSGRTTSVTVGKMPGRQAIIYDKREEVLVKHKAEWAHVWGRAINGPEASPLDLSEREVSQIWRVEVRAAKRHLKDVWQINSWASLYQMLPMVYETMLSDIRYCKPGCDKNRSRWEDHEMWVSVREVVAANLFAHVPRLSSEEYVEVKRAQKLDELESQMLGLAVSTAAIKGVLPTAFSTHLAALMNAIALRAKRNHRPLAEQFEARITKYRHLVE